MKITVSVDKPERRADRVTYDIDYQNKEIEFDIDCPTEQHKQDARFAVDSVKSVYEGKGVLSNKELEEMAWNIKTAILNKWDRV